MFGYIFVILIYVYSIRYPVRHSSVFSFWMTQFLPSSDWFVPWLLHSRFINDLFLALWLYVIRHFYNTNFLYLVNVYYIVLYIIICFIYMSLWDCVFMRMSADGICYARSIIYWYYLRVVIILCEQMGFSISHIACFSDVSSCLYFSNVCPVALCRYYW